MNSAYSLVPLGDIVEFHRGYDLPAYERKSGGFPVFSSAGITGYHNRFKVDGENVITGRYGTIGKVYYYNGKCWPHNTALFVSDFKGNLPKYVFFLLQHVLNVDGRDKSTVPGVNRNDLYHLKVPFQSNTDIQSRLTRILSLLDQKIALNYAITAELEKAAKLLYDYWFVRFDFPDANGKPYRASGGAMEYDAKLKREIPKGWFADCLGKKLNMRRGVEPGSGAYSEVKTETESVPFIRVSDLGSEPALYISEEAAKGIRCIPTEVLVSFDGSVGKMAIAMEGAYSSGVRKITAKDDSYSDALIYFIFQSEEIQKTMAKYAVGSNILHAAGAIEHLMFPYDDDVAVAFMKRIEPIYQKIVANHRQSKELSELRDFLLPLLMSGWVTVAPDRNIVETDLFSKRRARICHRSHHTP
jgi:type I restriction enzyme S subunit